MRKLLTLALLAFIITITSTTAFAQVDPCYDLTAYCGGDQQCVSDFMPYLYVTCNGDASSLPSWQERYDIASGGMLPPPGSPGSNPDHAYQQCPPVPPNPGYIWMPDPYGPGGFIRVYPHLVSHTYYNTPPGCADYTWEYDVNHPF